MGKLMNQNVTPTKGFKLSLIAGILILSNSTLLGAATTWFLWIIPILPGSSANDPTMLYRLTAIGLICGVLVLVGALMLRSNPSHKKMWGIFIVIFSIPSVLTGGGFIIGFIVGIIGGVQAFSRRSQRQASMP